MENCPCGSGKIGSECCEPVIRGERKAESAEDLLRSRFTAFIRKDIDYIVKTIHPEKKRPDDEKSIGKWAKKTEWINLKIVEVRNGKPEDAHGTIEFIAEYVEKEVHQKHHEIAEFKKSEGNWYFYEGQLPSPEQFIRTTPKIGRNDPCSCGSGKKFKKCCGK